jgi:hypothetical protein
MERGKEFNISGKLSEEIAAVANTPERQEIIARTTATLNFGKTGPTTRVEAETLAKKETEKGAERK